MIGNNTLMLNQATMIEAVQEYLDRRSTDLGHVKVKGVVGVTDGFKVLVGEPEDEKKEG